MENIMEHKIIKISVNYTDEEIVELKGGIKVHIKMEQEHGTFVKHRIILEWFNSFIALEEFHTNIPMSGQKWGWKTKEEAIMATKNRKLDSLKSQRNELNRQISTLKKETLDI